MTLPNSIVFLVDVDNTLLDNDRIQDDIKRHLDREFGVACRERYWTILEQLFTNLGYRDYLGTLQRYRVEHPQDIHLLSMSSFLVDYPFANRLYPGSLDVLERFRSWGQTVILSDGAVVFQPRKIERSGIFEAVEGNVLISIHKEEALDDVRRRYPAEHYVLVDDKLRILTTVKQAMSSRVTKVFPRQGRYAHDRKIIAACPPADLTVEHIGDWVQAGGMVGRIHEIKWRSTSLRTEDGDVVIVPNSRLLDAEVHNLSRPNNVHRMWVKVGFHYRHPPNEVKRILLDAVRGRPGVRAEPAPDCVLLDFADSAITYALSSWISDFAHHAAIESEVRTRIWSAARRGGLEIPFPIRTILMPTVAPESAAVVHNDGADLPGNGALAH